MNAAVLRTHAEQMSLSIAGIVRTAGEVAEGTTVQARTLDSTLSHLGELSASLADTAGQAESATMSSDGLLSSINEIAASIEQVSANTTSLASSVAQTAASAQQSA
ncbi:MAG: methyl-accepting chemotaxis protein, partial [Vicinamibacterales bacterium]